MAYVLLLALIAIGVPLALSLRDRVDSEVRTQAASQADVLATSAAGAIAEGDDSTLQRLVGQSRRSVGGRVLILDSGGRVLADSSRQGAVGEDYGSRPEIRAALNGKDYQDTRGSETLGIEILATAVPVVDRGRTVGAVRVTQSVEAVNLAVDRAIGGLVLLAAVVLALGLIAGLLIAAQISRPIRRLEDAARRVAEGDLDAKAPIEGSDEQRALAQSFNEMTGRVSRLLQSQRDFVADASHQLRTPLTGVRLRMEEAREATDDADLAAELEAGMHEVDRLSHIVDELLILSRAGEHEAPASEVSLGDAVARGVERWRGTAAARQIELGCSEVDAGIAFCARADLDRALDALIENAITYSPSRGRVFVKAAGSRIEVTDEGPGLEPGEVDDLFKRFFRGHAGRLGADGTGLGLAIARELIGQWGGSVELTNREEGGARAAIDLPPVRSYAGAH